MAATAGYHSVYIPLNDILTLYDDNGLRSSFTMQHRVPLHNKGIVKGIAVSQASETAYVLSEEGIISMVNTKAFTLTWNRLLQALDLIQKNSGNAKRDLGNNSLNYKFFKKTYSSRIDKPTCVLQNKSGNLISHEDKL